MCCALLAFATDYDCWRPHAAGQTKQALLAEIIGHVKVATENAVGVLRRAVEELAASPPRPCPCQDALALAIWSRRDRISREAIERAGPLVAKYLGPGEGA